MPIMGASSVVVFLLVAQQMPSTHLKIGGEGKMWININVLNQRKERLYTKTPIIPFIIFVKTQKIKFTVKRMKE